MEENQNAVGRFLDPDKIISQLNLNPGDVVVDFGCGPGYFSIPFAKIVGDDGRVIALDVLSHVLETVDGKAKNLGLTNVTTSRVNFEKANGTKLEDNSADWVILKDVLFQNKEKEIVIIEAHRVLKSGGKTLIIEWNQKDASVGPAMDIRISEIALEKMLNENGLIVEKNIKAGDFHYAFVAVKN